jgi:hypothetical protein
MSLDDITAPARHVAVIGRAATLARVESATTFATQSWQRVATADMAAVQAEPVEQRGRIR